MKILVALKMGGTVTKMTLQPLTKIKNVEKIYVVRDRPAPKISKVTYYCPPKILTKFSLGRVISKLVLMIYLMVAKKPDFVTAYYTLPHGINALICAKIFNKPVSVNIMGSPKMWNKQFLSLKDKLMSLVLSYFDVITTTGRASKEYLMEQGLNENKIFILPDSIDMKRFRPIPISKKYDLISIGRLSPEKNIETLLKAVVNVRRFKNDLTVGIVGNGPSKDSLESLRDKLGITENVKFLGFKDNTEFYYNCSKIYVLTSVTEGLPMAMLEAMACGLPCIVSNVGDVTNAAIDRFNAIVIKDPYDIDAFTSAILKLLKDNELYKSFSKNALKIRDTYSYERATEVWGKINDSLFCQND